MKIAWTKRAIADLNAAYDYVAEAAPDAAEVIIERIEKSLESLRQFPEMGRPGRVKDLSTGQKLAKGAQERVS